MKRKRKFVSKTGRLKNIRPSEVSLVSDPANKRKWFVVKSKKKGTTMKLSRIAKLMGKINDDDLDDEVLETIEKSRISKEDRKELGSALKTLEGYAENFPTEVNEAICKMATLALSQEPAEENEDGDKILSGLATVTKNQRKIMAAIKKGKTTGLYTEKELQDAIDNAIDETAEELGISKSADGDDEEEELEDVDDDSEEEEEEESSDDSDDDDSDED